MSKNMFCVVAVAMLFCSLSACGSNNGEETAAKQLVISGVVKDVDICISAYKQFPAGRKFMLVKMANGKIFIFQNWSERIVIGKFNSIYYELSDQFGAYVNEKMKVIKDVKIGEAPGFVKK